MKKSVVAILVILALVMLISPGIVGKLAEKSVDEQLRWAADEDRDVVVTSESFDRGWFSSAGRHRIELGKTSVGAQFLEQLGPGRDSPAPALIIDTELDHGLIPVTSLTREQGSLAPGLGRARSKVSIESADGEILELPGIVHSHVGLDGGLTSHYRVAADSARGVSWGDVSIEVAADALDGRFVVDGGLESLSFVNPDFETVSLDGIGFSSDMKMTDFGYAVGDLAFSVAAMQWPSDGGAVNVGPVAFDGRSSLDGERLDIAADMDFAIAGPAPVGDVSWSFDFVVNGWDAATAGRLQRAVRSAQGAADPDALFAVARRDLEHLFAKGFEARFDQLDVTLPQGTLVSTIAVDIAPTDPSSFVWTGLLLSLDARADVRLPAALLEFATAMHPQLNAAVAGGFLKRSGDNYEMAARYRKGLLTVNGAPFPLPLPAPGS